MPFKMLCLDIDGTLLNSQHRVSERTRSAVRWAMEERNVMAVLVSARMPAGIQYLMNEIGIEGPAICYSGGLIIHPREKGTYEPLADWAIPSSTAEEACRLIRDKGIHASVYQGNHWYVEELDKWARQEADITGTVPLTKPFDELLGEWKDTCTGPHKILCMGEEKGIEELQQGLKRSFDKDLNIYRSKTTYLEIMSQEASKPRAIQFLQKRHQIDTREIMAVGDNYNDMDMLRYVGWGIAMGNAPEEVKKAADAVTRANDEDGVAFAIEAYLSK